MPRRRRIKSFLTFFKKIKVKAMLLILKAFSWLKEFLLKAVSFFDFILLSKIVEIVSWIGPQFLTWWRWLLNNVKTRWLVIMTISLAVLLILLNPSIREEIFYFAKEVFDIINDMIIASEIIPWIKVLLASNINFIGLAIIFILVGLILGFVWTVILESAIILSMLTFLVYGIQYWIQGYCKPKRGFEESVSNESIDQIADKTFDKEFCSNMDSLFSGIGAFLSSDFLKNYPELIFTFVFAVFIPMYTYILNRKRTFIIVRNENFFGLKNNKVSFAISILNNSKRIRIIKRVFLLANNKWTFLIKDYRKDMATLMPSQVTSLNMESKIFKKENKFFSIKGKEKLSSAYLYFEMLDGYWGGKLRLTSPISTILLSPYRFKDEFLIPAPKAKLSKTLIWNEKKSR